MLNTRGTFWIGVLPSMISPDASTSRVSRTRVRCCRTHAQLTPRVVSKPVTMRQCYCSCQGWRHHLCTAWIVFRLQREHHPVVGAPTQPKPARHPLVHSASFEGTQNTNSVHQTASSRYPVTENEKLQPPYPVYVLHDNNLIDSAQRSRSLLENFTGKIASTTTQ